MDTTARRKRKPRARDATPEAAAAAGRAVAPLKHEKEAPPLPAPVSRRSDAPVSRAQQKRRTRGALMDAALRLMSGGRSYTSLSLREITREAGVVPTSFYRHFSDLEDLGLALVEETGLTLRRLL